MPDPDRLSSITCNQQQQAAAALQRSMLALAAPRLRPAFYWRKHLDGRRALEIDIDRELRS
jgi:hypothetical protein